MRSRQIVCCFPSALADQSSKVRLSSRRFAFVEFCHCASLVGFLARGPSWWNSLVHLLQNHVEAPLKRNPYLSQIVKRSRPKKHEEI